MENLDLRKAVAIALGCKPEDRDFGFDTILPCCTCDDNRHGSDNETDPYKRIIDFCELDHHAALDALMEFCEGMAKWELEDWSDLYEKRYVCRIVRDPRCEAKSFVGKNKSLALAICKAIVEAAQKSEKEGR